MTHKGPLTPLPKENLVLETDRLILRPLTLEDTDLAISMFTDPEVVRYVCDLGTPDQIAEDMKSQVKRGAGGRIGIWSVSLKDTRERIGSCVLMPVPIDEDDYDWTTIVEDRYPDGEIETGYLLRPMAWGQGFATEICNRLLEFGFTEASLAEIVATTDPDNKASQNVLKKCGFSDEGLQRAYATECSFFRLSRNDWRARVDSKLKH